MEHVSYDVEIPRRKEPEGLVEHVSEGKSQKDL